MLLRPEVRLPPAETPRPPAPADAPPLHPAKALVSTAIDVPQTLIGAVIGATTWLPPRMLLLPEVRLPPAETPRPPAPADAPPLQSASALPARAVGIPQSFTGAGIRAPTWLPLRMLVRPP